ncbi:hypothetical protein TWF281_006305 [Arthrobotrys megalospora]
MVCAGSRLQALLPASVLLTVTVAAGMENVVQLLNTVVLDTARKEIVLGWGIVPTATAARNTVMLRVAGRLEIAALKLGNAEVRMLNVGPGTAHMAPALAQPQLPPPQHHCPLLSLQVQTVLAGSSTSINVQGIPASIGATAVQQKVSAERLRSTASTFLAVNQIMGSVTQLSSSLPSQRLRLRQYHQPQQLQFSHLRLFNPARYRIASDGATLRVAIVVPTLSRGSKQPL